MKGGCGGGDDGGGGGKAAGSLQLTSVLRDRDNVTLVADDRLVLPFLADALGCDEPAAALAVEQLCAVLPPARDRLRSIGVPTLANMCGDLPRLSRRLVELKRLFPSCDVAVMVCSGPHLLTEDLDDVIAPSLNALRRLFPEAGEDGKPDVDRMVQAVPQLLDATFAVDAVGAVATSFGKTTDEAARMVHANPRLALRVESSAVRSRYSVSFDQTNVVRNKVVAREESGEEGDEYYRNQIPHISKSKLL